MLIFFNKTINTQQKSDFSYSYHIREKKYRAHHNEAPFYVSTLLIKFSLQALDDTVFFKLCSHLFLHLASLFACYSCKVLGIVSIDDGTA